jgi:hypothetical protein
MPGASVAGLVYLLLIVLAAGVGATPGLTVWAGAGVGWRWRRRQSDTARTGEPDPTVVRAVPLPKA